jgi:quinol monooxygenase YgiN
MYGTVANLRIKPGAEAKLMDLSKQDEALQIPGYLFQYVYRLDGSATSAIMAVGFESKAAYDANAKSPEQYARYLQFRELLEEDPVWHDGEIVHSHVRT